jgi:hypothetical protein
MTSPDDYRQFALDCLKWADESEDPGHRDTLTRIARMWMHTAIELDERITLVVREPNIFQRLRDKLE